MRALRSVTVVAALVLCGCTGGEQDDAELAAGASDPTASSPGGDAPTAPAPSPPRAGPGPLVGSWQQDVGALLTALGGAPGDGSSTVADCAGPVTLHFAAGSAFRYSLDGTCTAGGSSVEVSTGFQGTYADDGAHLSVPGASTRTEVVVDGAVVPTQALDAWVAALQEPRPYAVTDGTLSYSYSAPTGQAVQLVFERVG